MEPRLAAVMGGVVWITGLSGAGKSTIARAVYERLCAHGHARAALVDGDVFRALTGADVGHDLEGRLLNARRIAAYCAARADEGSLVVCATMSLFHEIRRWNRRHVARYLEVYLRAPLEVLVRRDAKGLYRAALAGRVRGVVGVDLPYDEPAEPDLVLDQGAAPLEVGTAVDVIMQRAAGLGLVGAAGEASP
ncbi:MAG: adenylyl-sulfate kinase [bacterium]|nr:adenylyl-sulfate kinase [bacterium]